MCISFHDMKLFCPIERVLQDGLYYEFTRHSLGAVVMMYGEEGQEMPWAVVRFKMWVEWVDGSWDRCLVNHISYHLLTAGQRNVRQRTVTPKD